MMKNSIARVFCFVAVSLLAVDAFADETASASREQTAVDAALKRDVAVALTTAAPTTDAAVPVRATGGPIEAKSSGLGVAAGATKAQSSNGAGSPNGFEGPQVSSGVVRPPARPQRGRRAVAKAEDPQRAVLDGMNGTFASCLTPADANIESAAVLNASVSPAGDVVSVASVTPGGVSPKAAACFREVLAHAKFAAVAEPAVVQVRLVPRELRARTAAVAQN